MNKYNNRFISLLWQFFIPNIRKIIFVSQKVTSHLLLRSILPESDHHLLINHFQTFQ